MTVINNLTAAAWATSGAASVGSTGLSALTGTWTHVGSTDVPTGSSANGYISLASGASGTFRIDGTTIPFTASTDYWVRFWIKPVRDTTVTLAVDNTILFIHTMTSTGTKLRMNLALLNAPSSAVTGYSTGYSVAATEFVTGGVNSGLSGGVSIPFNTWSQVTIHMRVNATDGRYGAYVNGVLVTEQQSLDTSTAQIATVDTQSSWSISLGGVAGLQFLLSGPIDSWSGSDISVHPLYTLEPETSYQTKRFGHLGPTSLYSQGLMFSYAGTGTQTLTAYASSGINPRLRRAVVTGTVGQTATVTTIDDIGTLPFNAYGWATVFFSDFYVPGIGTTCDFVLRNTANSEDVVRLTYDGTNLKQGTTVLQPILKTSRYQLAIHLHSSGPATYSLIDETSSPASIQTYFSGPLTAWIPQALGVGAYQGVYGNTTFELGSLSIHRWLEMSGVDSLSTAGVASLVPEKQGPNHVGLAFQGYWDTYMVPNSWGLRNEWVTKGYGRRGIVVQIGRSGLSRASFNTFVLAGMSYARGIVLWNIDGGSINDVGAGNSAGSVSTKTAIMSTNLELAITTLVPNNNQVILSTMMRREQGTYTVNDNLIINGFNAEVNRLFALYRAGGLVYLTTPTTIVPLHRGLQTTGDNTHPSAFGDYVLGREMVSTLTNSGLVRRTR